MGIAFVVSELKTNDLYFFWFCLYYTWIKQVSFREEKSANN